MNEEVKDTLDDIIEEITGTSEKVKKVVDLHTKIHKMLEEHDFSVRMSTASLIMSRAILDESDDYNEAYGYVARVSHTLVDVIDAHKEKQSVEDEDDDNRTIQ